MRTRHPVLGLVFPLVLGLALSSSVVSAAPPDPKQRAAELFAGGTASFKRGDFSAAGAAFEQAALYAPHPATVLDAAEAWELAGNPVRAAELCDRALAMPGIEPRHSKIARAQLDRVEPKIATIDVQVSADTRVAVDAEPEVAGRRRVRLHPGAHTIGVVEPGAARARETMTLSAGDLRKWSPSETSAPPAPAPRPATAPSIEPTPPPPTREAPSHISSYIAFGVAATAGVGAGIYGARTSSSVDDYNAQPSRATLDGFDRSVVTTDVFIGIAIGAAITGVVLWLTSSPQKTGSAHSSVSSW